MTLELSNEELLVLQRMARLAIAITELAEVATSIHLNVPHYGIAKSEKTVMERLAERLAKPKEGA